MIVVTGATGQAGSEVVRALAARGERVRAFVCDPGTASRMFGGNVELATGDLANPRSVRAALDGADALFLSNKTLIREVFETVIPAGDAAGLRALVAPDWIDHDPLPGQPAGLEGAGYVVSTMHGAHPDLRFTIDDLIAEHDRVTIRWTLQGTNTGPCSAVRRPVSRSSSPPS